MSHHEQNPSFTTTVPKEKLVGFKIEARTSRLIGQWAAAEIGLSGDDAEKYTKLVIATNLDEPGYDDVKRKIMYDFARHNINISESRVDAMLQKAIEQSSKQVGDDV